ncbi:hypothetical protein KC315_g34 [Hortaea werneckii]|nr:hypothetical protein KC315_g34 [Hortaea werneckii]
MLHITCEKQAFHRTQCQPHVIPCLTTVACFTISGGYIICRCSQPRGPEGFHDCKPWASAWLPPLHRHASARGRRRNVPALEAAKNEATDDYGRQVLRQRERIARCGTKFSGSFKRVDKRAVDENGRPRSGNLAATYR